MFTLQPVEHSENPNELHKRRVAQVLRWIILWRWTSPDHAAALVGLDSRSAEKFLKSLEDKGLIVPFVNKHLNKKLYRLGMNGAKLMKKFLLKTNPITNKTRLDKKNVRSDKFERYQRAAHDLAAQTAIMLLQQELQEPLNVSVSLVKKKDETLPDFTCKTVRGELIFGEYELADKRRDGAQQKMRDGVNLLEKQEQEGSPHLFYFFDSQQQWKYYLGIFDQVKWHTREKYTLDQNKFHWRTKVFFTLNQDDWRRTRVHFRHLPSESLPPLILPGDRYRLRLVTWYYFHWEYPFTDSKDMRLGVDLRWTFNSNPPTNDPPPWPERR